MTIEPEPVIVRLPADVVDELKREPPPSLKHITTIGKDGLPVTTVYSDVLSERLARTQQESKPTKEEEEDFPHPDTLTTSKTDLERPD